MTKTIIPAVFAAVILLSAVMASSVDIIPQADAAAMKSKGTGTNQYGSATKNKVCGDRLCSEPRDVKKEEPPVQEKKQEEAAKAQEKEKEYGSEAPKQPAPKETPKETPPMASMEPKAEWKTVSGTTTSSQDPGIGHESHQLAVILPPSDNIYVGTLTYDASEPIQLVSLQGPIAEGDEGGQPIWTTDGTTKFGLTLIDNGASAGSWNFAGNALAVHTKNTTPFTVSYSLHYMDAPVSGTIKSGTLLSVQDPGVGHESHQLAIVLPPRDVPYYGTVSYEASEPVQLVALHGPLKEGQDKGQAIWTPDGTTKYALTFVDTGKASGSWSFVGNALAFHTKNTTPFTVTYAVNGQ